MDSKNKTILIVEDESNLNEAYQLILAKSGYDILTSFDGREALDILSENKVHLILLDLRMPVMDGIEFLKEYSPETNERAKIIVFSNYDMQKEIEQAYDLGADKYILKSWASPKELIQVVGDVIDS
jgi:CheY-like chemotaxis protein